MKLPSGEDIPILGLGTWMMGDLTSQVEREISAVRYAIECGIRLIDTAEMYANGGAEKVVGEALKGLGGTQRRDIFIVSKVLPSNAHFEGVIQACERSLCRLNVDSIDLYLLHWRGSSPFQETLDAFESLRASGKIRYFGVSNFDTSDMDEWYRCSSGDVLTTNQILYNLSRRGVEWDLIPHCRKHGVPVMAYSPLEQGRLRDSPVLCQLAKRHNVAPLQIALAWVLAQENVIAIPKAVAKEHIEQNIAALEITLDIEDHALLDAHFFPPSGPSSLEIL